MADGMARKGLPRSRRLRRRAEFLRVQDAGARVTTRNLLLLLAPRPDEEPARMGVVASRKVGGAVQRNRAKRLVREAFRKHPEIFPARTDVVVIVRPGVDRLSSVEIEAEILAVAPLLRKRASGRTGPPNPKPPREKSGGEEKSRRPDGPPGGSRGAR
jgi:ribonuclease P protein component